MSDNRKPSWIGIGVLSVGFGAALIALTSARLTEGEQMFRMIVIVVLFYLLLGVLANWRVDSREENQIGPDSRIDFQTRSAARGAERQMNPIRNERLGPASTAKALRYEEN